MSPERSSNRFRCAVLSVVKHDYVPRGVAVHPRFELTVVADDPGCPDWVHERNQAFADEYQIPYVRDVERACREYDVQVAVVSPEAERHCDLSVRAARAGLHVVQDKPMSTRLSECDRLVEAVEQAGVQFLMWNRNFMPAIMHARELLRQGRIGVPHAIHVDFFFSKDSGPPKGSRGPGDPPISWLARQIEAHVDGSDGGVGTVAMGELEIEGIYPLAYMQTLMGAEVERVFARTASWFHQVHADNQVEDLATVTLEMERGLLGTLCIGRIGAASHPDSCEIKVHVLGSTGAAVIAEAKPQIGVYYRGQPALAERNRRLAIDNDYQLMQHFAEAIDGRRSTTILDARVGRAICATVEAAIASGRSGESVQVNRRGS